MKNSQRARANTVIDGETQSFPAEEWDKDALSPLVFWLEMLQARAIKQEIT